MVQQHEPVAGGVQVVEAERGHLFGSEHLVLVELFEEPPVAGHQTPEFASDVDPAPGRALYRGDVRPCRRWFIHHVSPWDRYGAQTG
ncbi:hypothetical protein Ari01nite_69590 [Paractinoplanes rishiriensis]|uniref:Uncharacterized protein n=1 Tax=Paractinoplanes rishiriensis TaxID=1050105 RepID=A0A919K4N5_9ACTN|nr:hypothetical protein Ari01nite_69590 [Actinoplanes rishiriensis]